MEARGFLEYGIDVGFLVLVPALDLDVVEGHGAEGGGLFCDICDFSWQIIDYVRVRKNTLEYLGLWELLNNPYFKGGEFDLLLREAGSNAFTMSPSRWIELTGSIGLMIRDGAADKQKMIRTLAQSPNRT